MKLFTKAVKFIKAGAGLITDFQKGGLTNTVFEPSNLEILVTLVGI